MAAERRSPYLFLKNSGHVPKTSGLLCKINAIFIDFLFIVAIISLNHDLVLCMGKWSSQIHNKKQDSTYSVIKKKKEKKNIKKKKSQNKTFNFSLNKYFSFSFFMKFFYNSPIPHRGSLKKSWTGRWNTEQ